MSLRKLSKRRFLLHITLFSVFSMVTILPIFCQQSGTGLKNPPTSSSPVPYQKEEFPAWLLDLRRADIVAFGSLPFTLFFTTFAVDSYRFYSNDWDRRYAPWPLKAPGAIEMDENQRIASFSVAIGLSVVIAVVDYLIVQYKRNRQEELAPPILKPEIIVEPWSPEDLYDGTIPQNSETGPFQE